MKLGQKARCKVTGFEGTLTSRTEHLNGCVRWGIQPKVDKDGKLPDAYIFDECQLEVLSEEPVIAHEEKATGGPIEKAKWI